MKKFKIAIIAHNCRVGGSLSGTLNLLRVLKNVAQDEEFLVICSAGYGYEEIELPANSKMFLYEGRHSIVERYWFELVKLPRVIQHYGPDVIFGAGNIGLINPCAPQALLIHMAYLLYDKKYYPDIHVRSRLRVISLKLQIKKALPATQLIFSQTPVVKRRFAKNFCYPENHINILRWPPPAACRRASGRSTLSTV